MAESTDASRSLREYFSPSLHRNLKEIDPQVTAYPHDHLPLEAPPKEFHAYDTPLPRNPTPSPRFHTLFAFLKQSFRPL